MKNSNLFNCLGLIILIVTVYLLCIHYYKSPAINIEPELLFHILQPGTYTGVSNYSATKLYKNGLHCTHKVIISKTGANDIDVVKGVLEEVNILVNDVVEEKVNDIWKETVDEKADETMDEGMESNIKDKVEMKLKNRVNKVVRKKLERSS